MRSCAHAVQTGRAPCAELPAVMKTPPRKATLSHAMLAAVSARVRAGKVADRQGRGPTARASPTPVRVSQDRPVGPT